MKVLFVDDEIPNTDLFTGYFKDHGFPETDAVYTSKSAIEYLQANPVNLVFLDIGLGEDDDASGMKVLKWIHDAGLDIRVVMLSAYDNYKMQAQDWGASDYCVKPCLPRQCLKIAQQYS
jgi:DNA-binding response OmpR family regulator